MDSALATITDPAEREAYLTQLTADSIAEWETDQPAPRRNAWAAKADASHDRRFEAKKEAAKAEATGAVPADYATPKQIAYIRSLLAERSGPDVEAIRGALNAAREAHLLTKKVASATIDALRQLPRSSAPSAPQAPAQAAPAPVAVPAGRYAVDNEDGTLRFYVVDTPTEGRWAGRTFVNVLASDERYPVRGAAAQAVLAKIAVDPQAACARYGQEIGRCGRCGRTLTDADSRARGIGPDCAEKDW
jgi:hypothetical protein